MRLCSSASTIRVEACACSAVSPTLPVPCPAREAGLACPLFLYRHENSCEPAFPSALCAGKGSLSRGALYLPTSPLLWYVDPNYSCCSGPCIYPTALSSVPTSLNVQSWVSPTPPTWSCVAPRLGSPQPGCEHPSEGQVSGTSKAGHTRVHDYPCHIHSAVLAPHQGPSLATFKTSVP